MEEREGKSEVEEKEVKVRRGKSQDMPLSASPAPPQTGQPLSSPS